MKSNRASNSGLGGVAVVAEKPQVARDIARVLGAHGRGDGVLVGNGYTVTWAIGHLVGLAEPHEMNPAWKKWNRAQLPMLPSSWPLSVLSGTRAQFEVLKRVLRSQDITEVICATDAGREGELIFRLIYEATGCTHRVRRLWISSLTDEAIRAGFQRLRPDRALHPLAEAARGRSRADWLVGMNLSRAYGLSLHEPLSVGRVQTPTLALVVERELDIRHFVPEAYLEVVGTFVPIQKEDAVYEGTWFSAESNDKAKAHRLPSDGALARAIVERVKGGQAHVAEVEAEEKRIPPPKLYDLTELQRHANRLYGLSAQRTLEAAQSLYERHKLLSYPRTDSRHLSTEVAKTLPDVVAAIAPAYPGLVAPGSGSRPLSRRFVDDAEVGEHHGLLPTARSPRGQSLSSDEQRIYDLVCRRLLAAWHPDFVWTVTTVLTQVQSTHALDHFHSSGTTVKQPGWKVLDLKGKETEQNLLPKLAAGETVQVRSVRADEKTTRPPPRHTEATLLTAMETAGRQLDDRELQEAMRGLGLGTPATRAAIIETLLARDYLRRDGKALIPTERGLRLIEVVDPEVKSPVMTGRWEAQLERIARGEAELGPFLDDICSYVRQVVERVPPSFDPRPDGGPHPSRRNHALGPSGASPSFASAPPSAAERAALRRTLELLRERDRQGTSRLAQTVWGDAPWVKPRFRQLLQGLVDEGLLTLEPDSFEKDGRLIQFQRACLTSQGQQARVTDETLAKLLFPPANTTFSGRGTSRHRPPRPRRKAQRAPRSPSRNRRRRSPR